LSTTKSLETSYNSDLSLLLFTVDRSSILEKNYNHDLTLLFVISLYIWNFRKNLWKYT